MYPFLAKLGEEVDDITDESHNSGPSFPAVPPVIWWGSQTPLKGEFEIKTDICYEEIKRRRGNKHGDIQ